MKECDVAVIGAGLAGLQAARRLGRTGLRVLLVESRPTVDRSITTTGIFVRRTLEQFALPADCLGPPIREVVLHAPSGRTLTLTSRDPEFRVGRMAPLYRHELRGCLHAGVEWWPTTRYLGCEPDGDASVLRLEGQGRPRWVRARFVAGADGARSLVAQDLGLDVNREWIVGVEEVYHGVRLETGSRLHCCLDPVLAPGYIGWVVEDPEEVHVGVGGYPSRFDPLNALMRFRERAAQIVPLGDAEPAERRGGRIPVGGVLRRIASRRGLLVGDAAGAPSPLTAGGLDACFRLSALAGRVASEWLATGDPRSLDPYSGGRFRARFASRLFMRRILGSVRSPRAMDAVVAALSVPPMRAAAHHVFFGRGSFPDVGLADLPAPVRTARGRS